MRALDLLKSIPFDSQYIYIYTELALTNIYPSEKKTNTSLLFFVGSQYEKLN